LSLFFRSSREWLVELRRRAAAKFFLKLLDAFLRGLELTAQVRDQIDERFGPDPPLSHILFELVNGIHTPVILANLADLGNADFTQWTATQELLILVLAERTQIRVSVTTMSRLLARLRVRLGRPKPMVNCPWPKRRRQRRLAAIRRLVRDIGRDDVVLYSDEVDIHLNPKIGPDWMLRGKQKKVLTPGCNDKRYLAGAFDPRTGKLTWVEGERKNSLLFLQLLHKLVTKTYRRARTIHIILDNYGIHDSLQVKLALKVLGSRVKFHFLPPYCPDHNRIERIWRDLHDNVTRNHRCKEMAELMLQVNCYLRNRTRHGRHTYAKVDPA
jgi:transposase